MKTLSNPLQDFKDRLVAFAQGERRGIRNPFVIVPVQPSIEQRLAKHMSDWHPGLELPKTTVRLDRLMPRTSVFQTVVSIPPGAFQQTHKGEASVNESIERTLRDNLAEEIIDLLLREHEEVKTNPHHVLLLLNLGSLYPFARASELFDELDRRRARATIGMPFPGRIYGGKLSFFGEEARHYYPAHRIDEQIKRAHLS